jgi:hypothetical protein
MKSAGRLFLATTFLLFVSISSFGGSRARFNGADSKGVEVECDCFKITFDDFHFVGTPTNFRVFEVLVLTLSNPGKDSCELFPYQFHLVRPNGEQLDVSEALSDADYQEFMTSRSYKMKPEEKTQPVVLMPGGSKRYRLNFGKDYPLERKKPSAFYYKDKVIGNFQYR